MTDYPYCDIKVALIERRDSLMERIARVKKNMVQEHSADWSEQAQERQNDEVLEAIGNESRAELNQINHAIERMDTGTYGNCCTCGEKINLERLQAVPYTDHCISCAETL